MTKYCGPCSAAADQERKNKWNAAHPRRGDILRADRAVYKRKILERASAVAVSLPRSILWEFDMPMPDMVRSVRIRIPFDRDLSKNAIYAMGRGGHVFIRQRQRQLREAIAWQIKGRELDPWPQRKTYVSILVQKPNNKFDAINVIDGICDALKVGLGIDDRWFAIQRLDWMIVKDAPEIIIGVGQDGVESQTACSSCGRILDDRHFPSHARICSWCTRGELAV